MKIVVLVSGSGTLLQAIFDAAEKPDFPVRVIAVGADRDGIAAFDRAEKAGVPYFSVQLADFADRLAWDLALSDAVAAYQPDVVVSAGFMKILGKTFLDRFPQRIINTHPALLPAFPGAHAVSDALAFGVKVTGSSIHFVDGGVDTGPVIAQEPVMVDVDDDESRLHERIKVVERRLLVDVLERLARGRCTIDGRKVII